MKILYTSSSPTIIIYHRLTHDHETSCLGLFVCVKNTPFFLWNLKFLTCFCAKPHPISSQFNFDGSRDIVAIVSQILNHRRTKR